MSGRSSTVDTLSIYDRNRGLSTDPPGPTSSPLKRTFHQKTREEVCEAEGWPAIQSNALSNIRFGFRARGALTGSTAANRPTHSSRRVEGQIAGSGWIVAQPDITPTFEFCP